MKRMIIYLAMLTSLTVGSQHALATTDANEPLLGEIKWVAFNFAPRGWARCDGQILPINSNQALFSLLGTMYGGDGRTTFALPEARGRLLMHTGQGSGLSNRVLGAKSGVETQVLATTELPSHGHTLMGSNSKADQLSTVANVYAKPSRTKTYDAAGNTTMSSAVVGTSGSGVAHQNMMPSTTMNCIIALVGTFPSRN